MKFKASRVFLNCLLVCLLCFLADGCRRHTAEQRVLDAVNPTEALASNGQCVILVLPNEYALIIPNYIEYNDIKYKFFLSRDGSFKINERPSNEGTINPGTPIMIEGVKVFIDYGGIGKTSIKLDLFDVQTGIAVLGTNDLPFLNVSSVDFKKAKRFNPSDLIHSIN
jgi:hypothetical protein